MKSIFRAFCHKTEALEKSCPIHGTNSRNVPSKQLQQRIFAELFCSVQRHRLALNDIWLSSGFLTDMIHNWITIPALLKNKVKILLYFYWFET